MPAGLALADEVLKALLEVAKRLSEVKLQRTDLVPYAFSRARADREDTRSETARKRAGSASDSGIAPQRSTRLPKRCLSASSGSALEIGELHGGDLLR